MRKNVQSKEHYINGYYYLKNSRGKTVETQQIMTKSQMKAKGRNKEKTWSEAWRKIFSFCLLIPSRNLKGLSFSLIIQIILKIEYSYLFVLNRMHLNYIYIPRFNINLKCQVRRSQLNHKLSTKQNCNYSINYVKCTGLYSFNLLFFKILNSYEFCRRSYDAFLVVAFISLRNSKFEN